MSTSDMFSQAAACLLTLWMAASAGAADVHVNGARGDNANTGHSPDMAVATLARGVSLLHAGDVLILAPGTYYETLRLGSMSGRPDAPIVVEGNGAVLSGLAPMPAAEWQARAGGAFWHPHSRYGALRPYLMAGARALPSHNTPTNLPPEHFCWTTNGVWFRPAEGKTIADYPLSGTLRASGVSIDGGCRIVRRNLTCERFSNDGFNVHGRSRGIRCENIVGRHDGDDGFSIHEDVDAAVYGGAFHDNDYGIQDVNASQSVFHGVLVESNRLAGIDFVGGFHSVGDSVARDNGGRQISLAGGSAKHIGFDTANPLTGWLINSSRVRIVGPTSEWEPSGGRKRVPFGDGTYIGAPSVA